jgi:hypothetical protein
MINAIEVLPRTNMQYLGYEETKQKEEFLRELNSRADLTLEQKVDVKEVKEVQEVKQVEKEIETDFSTVKPTVQLNQVLTHNVVQNIPTSEIMRIMSTKS